MSHYNKNLGDWGEDQACAFLVRKEFKILRRNYHTTFGEIDIVAKQGGDYYFIEVKTRDSVASEMANDLAITKNKRYKLQKTVKIYCYRNDIKDVGIVIAGIVVAFNRLTKTVNLRFCVFID